MSEGRAPTRTPSAVEGLDFRTPGPVPIYHQLATKIRTLIEAGELPGGTCLGTVGHLVEALHVSRSTVRLALRDLTNTGHACSAEPGMFFVR